jgi:uncharacterized protein YdiU (UPF0061 family)
MEIVRKSKVETINDYQNFDVINGSHSFKDKNPGSFVDYQARVRHGSKVRFFNFELAKEMGLISSLHENILKPELEKTIKKTFSLLIINEYDLLNNTKIPKEDIKEGQYMATRYLQLQHPDKTGRTSGDGRSIWYGEIQNNGRKWDISGCGTGATKLSPATSLYNKFFKSGDPSISYGCGYCEVDESLGTLFFSEVFNKNNISTERVLAILEFDKGISITVRAHECLIRPSHFFCHLKQSNYERLKNITDYYIDQQIKYKKYPKMPNDEKVRYEYFLKEIVKTFAKTTSRFEDEYIFCWMDWDGDNILMDGGIIDYGSIRQFGLFHSEYRYDDVQRYSTTILEQKAKVKYIVQSFIQIVDFLLTKKKKNISHFKDHVMMREFEKEFELIKDQNILKKIGFEPQYIDYLIKEARSDVKAFRKVFSYFEKTKSKKGMEKVADGINWNAVFCMRDILREFPQIYLSREKNIDEYEFIEIVKSNYAKKADLIVTNHRKKMIQLFQSFYLKLVKKSAKKFNLSQNELILKITMRSSIINKAERVTGDSVTYVVHKVLNHRPKLEASEIFELLEDFKNYQTLDPDIVKKMKIDKKHHSLMPTLMELVRDYREGI